jgi:D-3-phosphoglycerate dehydrogenase
MSAWKILISDGLHENGQMLLRSSAQVDDLNGLKADDLLTSVGKYDALIVRSRTKVSAAVLEAGARLQVVGRAGVGVDNIDLAAAAMRKVIVVNSPVSTSIAVAELAVGLMFALARSLPYADATMKTGQWLKKKLEGIELYGKTLGIVGVGNIGSALAQRAVALGMTVLGNDPILDSATISKRGAEPTDFQDLLQLADFVSIHIPLTPETRGLLNSQTLGMMKRGAYLICTARGGIIDETALLGALESGQVAGAALDVFASEPPGLTALVAHPKVIASPHIAAQTAEAQARAAQDIAQEVLAALRGEPLRWKVV